MNEKLQLLENRIDSISTNVKTNTPIQKVTYNPDGKIDFEPILHQISALNHLSTDLNSRLSIIERKEFIHPSSFASALESIHSHENRLTEVTTLTSSLNLKFAELKQIQEHLLNKDTSEEDQSKFKEIKDKINNIEEEMKKNIETIIKFNKDLISNKAAINTLRNHSEEASNAIEEMRKIIDSIKEDSISMDKRIKKVVGFVQTETNEISKQIVDINRSIERNEDKIEEIILKQNELTRKIQNNENSNNNTSISYFHHEPKIEKPGTKIIKTQNINKSSQSLVVEESITSNSNSNSETPPLTKPSLKRLDQINSIETSQNNIISFNQQSNLPLPLINSNITNTNNNKITELNKSTKVQKPLIIRPSEVTRADLRKYDELFNKITILENYNSNLLITIENINLKIKLLEENKVDKDELKSIFEQFRIAMSELNNRISIIKKQISNKVDQQQLDTILIEFNKKNKHIEEQQSQIQNKKIIQNPIEETLIIKNYNKQYDGGESCLVYDENGSLFYGRNNDGKPIVTKK